MKNKKIYTSALILGAALISDVAFAACSAPLPTHANLVAALKAAQLKANGGFGLNMWATVVTRGGVVCDVAYTGATPGQQWLGSRVISAQKANTANAFSLPTIGAALGLALSTANLYTATQPGGSLFGLQESNPVNVAAAYAGAFADFGTILDPMIGQRIGGVNVFGGGLALYSGTTGNPGTLIGAIGVSGDSSCADHNIAWRTRHALNLDHVPKGVHPIATSTTLSDDNIIYDISYGDLGGFTSGTDEAPVLGKSAKGWGHPQCSALATAIAVGGTIPAGQPGAGTYLGFAKAGTTAATVDP